MPGDVGQVGVAAGLTRGTTWAKVWRYAGSSVIAAGCSELTLLLLYGAFDLSPGWSSSLAWIAGAVPNYWLNRSWAWRLTGRPDLRREVLPYALIVAVTLLLAIVSTRAVDEALRAAGTASETRVLAVAATFLGVYVVVFFLRFLLLDRLFSRSPTSQERHDRRPDHA